MTKGNGKPKIDWTDPEQKRAYYRVKGREWYRNCGEARREQLREYQRSYYHKHREELKEAVRQWKADHPEKVAEYQRRSNEKRRLKRQQGKGPLPQGKGDAQ